MSTQSSKPLFPDPNSPAKRRTARIARNYLSRTSFWDSNKKRWAWLMVVAGGLVVLYTVTIRTGAQAFSRGPVISAHAIHENSCEKCHQDFAPISGEAAGFRLAEWSHTQDSKCQKCHLMPQHNARSVYDSDLQIAEANCASCHQDHQGRAFDLKNVADRHCTNCHQDLEQHRKFVENKPGDSASNHLTAIIKSFNDNSHPDFRSIVDLQTEKIKTDPSRLKFNHAMHMSAGIPQTLTNVPKSDDTTPRKPFTNSELANYGTALGKGELYKNLYATNGQQEIQMNCADCHELNRDNPKFANAGLALGENTSTAGDYYLPVIYERHCAACHTLPYQAGGSHSPEHYVPHQATSKQLQDFVERKIYHSTIKEDPALDQQINQRPPVMPGNRLSDIIPPKIQAQIDTAIRKSAHSLTTQTCYKCHAEITTSESNPFPQVPPAKVPRRWYEHAKFNHHSHRDVECRACHNQAFANDPSASIESTDILIPQKQNCQQCHAPANTDSLGKITGGAGHHCTECHSYHNHSPISALNMPTAGLSAVIEFFSAHPKQAAFGTSIQNNSTNE